jgi:hypothetical protein
VVTSLDKLTDDPVFAGIDWGGASHQLCVVDATGQVLVQRRVRHDAAGLAELDEQLARWPGIKVAIERGEGLLGEHLQQHGLLVYCICPKISVRVRERYRLAATKSDHF